MSADFEWILEDCLQRLRSGQSPEECLAAYPDHAEGLRPLLHVASHIRTSPAPKPRPQAVQAGRERMLAAARSNPARNSFVQPVSSGAFSRYIVRIFTALKAFLFGKETHGMKLALRLAIDLMVILIIGGVLTVNASAYSLPGDPLYGVKRTWEEVRLTLSLNDPARQQLQEQFQQLRLDEVQQMIRLGRTGLVDFQGPLESIASNEWVVSGIRVNMLPDTIVEGDPTVGQTVRVRARLQSGGVLTALQVQMQTQANKQTPYPSPMSGHTPMPTYEPTHEPEHMLQPTYEPNQQPGMNDGQPNNMPAPTSMPNNDHHNDSNDHDGSGGSSMMGGGSGPHH